MAVFSRPFPEEVCDPLPHAPHAPDLSLLGGGAGVFGEVFLKVSRLTRRTCGQMQRQVLCPQAPSGGPASAHLGPGRKRKHTGAQVQEAGAGAGLGTAVVLPARAGGVGPRGSGAGGLKC